ncbi:MAG TPA: thiolase domain-containing protein [Conexivisphaerales archaeon]|nr:thiolase domain-containing protein [Conexivisphaerales archaeon]
MFKKRDVAIISAATAKCGERWESGIKDLVWEAGVKALDDAGISGKDVEYMVVGNMSGGMFVGQEHIGALVADFLGLNPIPSLRVEAACASGGIAFSQGYMAVASGLYDIVAVGGVEKMTDVDTDQATSVLSGAMDFEWEAYFGATFPGLYALMATRYLHDFNVRREILAKVAVKNHYHGSLNPLAHFRNRITEEEALTAPMVAYPLRKYDCSPISDGAAAAILAPLEIAKKYTDTPILVEACVPATDTLSLLKRRDICTVDATVNAARKAFQLSGRERRDIDVMEVHDCFTIAELLAIEDMGFCKKGEAGKLYEEGQTYADGSLPVNTDGGLKAAGHPVGATGVKQISELVKQLRGQAEKGRQVSGAEVGLAHNVGGSGATAVVTILSRRS